MNHFTTEADGKDFFPFFFSLQRTDQTSLYNLCQWSLWSTQAVLMGSSDKAPFE